MSSGGGGEGKVNFKVGDTVKVEGKGPLTAVVRFIGKTKFQEGIWYGVEFDGDGMWVMLSSVAIVLLAWRVWLGRAHIFFSR